LGPGKARANLHIKSASLSIARLCARGKHLVAEMRRLELRQYRKTACLGKFRAQSVLGAASFAPMPVTVLFRRPGKIPTGQFPSVGTVPLLETGRGFF
jgi:hypothetical protein